MDGTTGVISIAVTFAELTVILRVEETLPTVAVMTALPEAMPDSRFGASLVLNVATDGELLAQTT
jgi:hypothetical protein